MLGFQKVGTSVTYFVKGTDEQRRVDFYRDGNNSVSTEARVHSIAGKFLFTVKGDHCWVGQTKLCDMMSGMQNIFLSSKKTAEENSAGVEKRLFFTFVAGSLED